MKSLPIFTASIVALVGVGWIVNEPTSWTLLAQQTAAPQPATEKADAAEKSAKMELPPENLDALAVLHEARENLFDRGSIQAKLRETIRMGRRKFQAEGEYISGRYPKLRLNIKIQAGDTRAELLEVCDGHILWTVQKLATGASEDPEEQVARTVINDVQEAWRETYSVPGTDLIASMGVGGLPSLLASLERSMIFEALRELEVDGDQFSVIQGRWNDDIRNRFKDANGEIRFPDYVPDHVRIYIDARTAFPTRILYLKETEPGSDRFKALLSLEFWDVVLDGPVSEDLFHYTPAELTQVRDRTRDFLEMIKSAAESADNSEATDADQAQPVDEK